MKKNANYSLRNPFRGILTVSVILFLSLFTALPVLCQDDMPVTAVCACKMNVFYLGVDNPVKVVVSDCKPSEMVVTVSNGTITGSACKYVVRPETEGMAIVRVSVKGVIVGSSDFRVKMLPTPVAKIAGCKTGSIQKSTLLTAEKMEAVMENFDFIATCKILGFKMSANQFQQVTDKKSGKVTEQGADVELLSTSELITPEQKKLLEQLKPGQKVYFEEIKASCPDGTIRDLGALILKVE
ncbi:MAG: GldM family protein [Bacteroidales bacterium]